MQNPRYLKHCWMASAVSDIHRGKNFLIFRDAADQNFSYIFRNIQFQVTFGPLHPGKSVSFCHSVPGTFRGLFNEFFVPAPVLSETLLMPNQLFSLTLDTSGSCPFSICPQIRNQIWRKFGYDSRVHMGSIHEKKLEAENFELLARQVPKLNSFRETMPEI